MSCHCQQDALYTAQQECDPGAALTYERAQELANEVRERPWFLRNFDDHVFVIDVHERESYRFGPYVAGGDAHYNARTQSGVVGLAQVGLYELYLWHEVAHVLTEARYGRNAHGPWFARTFLEVVYTMMGSDAYTELRAAFDRHGVDHDTDSAVPGGVPL